MNANKNGVDIGLIIIFIIVIILLRLLSKIAELIFSKLLFGFIYSSYSFA